MSTQPYRYGEQAYMKYVTEACVNGFLEGRPMKGQDGTADSDQVMAPTLFFSLRVSEDG
jgi:hypothetical protein